MAKSTKNSTKVVAEHVDETVTPTGSDDVTSYINANEFDIKKFYVKPVEEKMGTKSQYMAFPKIKGKTSKDDESVIIVTEPIKMTKGGIPKIDGEYKKSDKDREFFWLGEDKTQQACVDLFNGLRKIDERYSDLIATNSESKVIHLLKDGKKEPLDKLEYVSLVRESGSPDNAKDSDKQYEPYDRIKVRFSTKYDADKAEGEPSEITTHLFLLDNEEPESYTSVTDFEKSLRWNCEARFVLMINKFWAMKALKNKKRECGFTVKCLQIYITKVSTSGAGVTQVEKFRKRLFATPTSTTPAIAEAPVATKQTKATKKEETESSESDSDDEVPPPKKDVKSNSKAKKEETESESSESESDKEVPPPKKNTKATSKAKKEETESESSESESEDSPPPKKGVKATTTSKAKKEESSEESDSEDEKPKAKPKGKAK
jgi:hypothetical protein